ncbi:unnamed protein product [Bursaphelenchus okinawaensis]|uniref:Translocon-associated protein subunit delta n=1 Tax=Bursaphelenchus okinawaensis TaxID=465554 RepID=A0A811KXS5_9BILA|nr:unnamed protein product [Bursaphelenchus okinawaensis]CAG9112776.1 unnamed protein product [Bursaphelenchus okinawaensis]
MNFVLLALLVSVAYAAKCESPQPTVSGFSTTDGFFHYHTSYIVEFSLQCSNNPKEVPLYAKINGKINQVAVSDETGNYQVSWSLPNEESSAQTFNVEVYDQDQYNKYVKAKGEGVEPSFTVSHYHPGVTRNWPISSETVALLVGFLGIYAIINYRADLKA